MATQASTITEHLSPEPAIGLAGLLDLPSGTIADGWPLPPLWHWMYLLDRPRQSELGPDGHPLRGIPEPPRPGLHRMYAGGRVTTHRPLRLGLPATSSISVTAVRERTGRSGPMTFVTTTRIIEQGDSTAVTDEVDILYREPTPLRAGEPTDDAPARDDGATRSVPVDETMLFRFSALTFNAHRIHYDIDYCRHEGYAGLVVHGPLQALLMAQHANFWPAGGETSTFHYRLVAPLVLGQGLQVSRKPDDRGGIVTEARDATDRRTATGAFQWS